MPKYDNTDRGALFTNNRKTKPNQPTHTGNIEVKCPHCGENTEFWLSAWVKTARDSGARFFSLAINPKEERDQSPPPEGAVSGGADDFDDDIPF